MPIFGRRTLKVPTAPSASGVFKDLASLLAFAPVAASLGERVQWIEDLIEWVRIPVAPEKNPKGSGQLQGARLRYLLQALEKNPPWQAAFTTLVISVLRETEPLSLFCEIGMGRDGIFADAAERVLRRVLPAPQDEKNLLELVGRIFSEEEDAEWIEGLGATAVVLANLLFSDPAVSEELRLKYRRAMSEALVVISSEAEAIGLSEEVRVRSQVESVTRSAYYRLRLAVTDVLEGRLPAADAAAAFTPLFLACREEINAAFAHLEERGVSVAIVYKLEKLERMLKRMETLLPMLFPIDGRDPAPEAWLPMVANLVRRRLEGSQVWSLVQGNLHMLARKIVERSGASGEHYITTSTREYVSMLLSAAGGGVITAFTAVLKVLVSKASPAPFFEGLFHWINFSGSFLTMQALHFTLATKQPSMTAPALASKLKESNDREEFSLLVARITRSQFAAAVGNIGATIPAAILIDLAWRLLTGHSFLSAEYAAHSVESLHPWKSFTIPFAILTGVLLWVSSIIAGWVENWFVYRRLPEAIGQSVWMPGRAGAISGWVVRNVGPVAGNLSLGFLLAYTTVVTKFFGVALEVRHVTISTATLTLAMMAGPDVRKTDLAMAMVSILLIGLLNFGVSFALALATAAKARDVGRVRLRLLRLALGRKFRQNPAHFFFPPYRPAVASSDKS